MSGICGIVTPGAKARHQAEIEAMIAPLRRRGPDGSHAFVAANIALGHTLLATTPEALIEKLPLTDAPSGCTITADVRLDNREELIADLEPGGGEIGDGELILRAYLVWGEACLKHLLGDFAFAIWDPRSRKLVCARDQMGMRQLIYHHAPGLFVFATEAEAILAHPNVPKRINEGRIADYLDDLEGLDLTSTPYQGLFRLPPAHCLIVAQGKVEVRRYWQLEAPPALELPSDQAYADAFRSVFTEAVRCRLRSSGPVGAMLSGGMDSGSVVAIASRLLDAGGRGPLCTFSAVAPQPAGCVETSAIHAALAMPGLAPVLVSHDGLDPIRGELQRMTEEIAEPFDGHMTLVRTIYATAHRAGHKVMLDGVAGDVVLTTGNRIADHLRKREFKTAWREARGEQHYWKARGHAARSLMASAWVAFAPMPLRLAKRRLVSLTGDVRLRLGHPVPWGLARRVSLRQRRNAFRGHVAANDVSDVEHRIESILHPHLTVARERYDRVAAASAIEPRDPFMDIRLIRFCLSLPAEQIQRDGWPKMILRRAMVGHLPDAVIWRRGKEHLGWAFTQALFARWPGWRERLFAGRTSLTRFAGAGVLRKVSRASLPPGALEQAIGLFYLQAWIDRNDLKRP